MLISELAKEVHENAVAHGWWDDELEAPEIIALIHSEWSEALEEARAGRPMAYIIVHDGWQGDPHEAIVERGQDGKYMYCGKEYSGKPEGAAVELIDGCIRILDYMGKLEADLQEDGRASEVEGLYTDANVAKVPEKLPELVAALHIYTAGSMMTRGFRDLSIPDIFPLLEGMAAALSWVKKQGLDPLAILLEKHAYNKTRPYKHGKKF